jgi:tRNA dimethylallyltransferase
VQKKTLISIVGPTGVGKTSLAVRLGTTLGTEIISADSRQFYKELNIGTAKPSETELSLVPHHFINSHSIFDSFDAGQYSENVDSLLKKLFKAHDCVLLVGGSGLYFTGVWDGFDDMPKSEDIRRSLVEAYEVEGLDPLLVELENADPEYHKEVDQYNKQRVIRALEVIRISGKPYSHFRKNRGKSGKYYTDLKIGLELPREQLYDQLNKRMDQMISDGLFEEAEKLHQHRELNALQTVGYTEIFGYLEKQYDYNEAVRLLKRNSRR